MARRRRRNPSSLAEWVSARSLVGAAAGLFVGSVLELRRASCSDGLPANLGCEDTTTAVHLAIAPLALGLLTQRGKPEPGTFRTGLVIGGAVAGAVLALDAITGEPRIARLFARVLETPRPPVDVASLPGSASVPHEVTTT